MDEVTQSIGMGQVYIWLVAVNLWFMKVSNYYH